MVETRPFIQPSFIMALQSILLLLLVATSTSSTTEATDITTEEAPTVVTTTDTGSESTPETSTSVAPCPPGSEWSSCVACGSDCASLHVVCTDVCREGCRCLEYGYVFHEGSCIPQSDCPTAEPTTEVTSPPEWLLSSEIPTTVAPCPSGAEWSSCVACGSDCASLHVVCTEVCREGCRCLEYGYVFHEGSCIPQSNCPTAEPTTEVTSPPEWLLSSEIPTTAEEPTTLLWLPSSEIPIAETTTEVPSPPIWLPSSEIPTTETTTLTISDTMEPALDTTQETSPTESTTTETAMMDWPTTTTESTTTETTTMDWPTTTTESTTTETTMMDWPTTTTESTTTETTMMDWPTTTTESTTTETTMIDWPTTTTTESTTTETTTTESTTTETTMMDWPTTTTTESTTTETTMVDWPTTTTETTTMETATTRTTWPTPTTLWPTSTTTPTTVRPTSTTTTPTTVRPTSTTSTTPTMAWPTSTTSTTSTTPTTVRPTSTTTPTTVKPTSTTTTPTTVRPSSTTSTTPTTVRPTSTTSTTPTTVWPTSTATPTTTSANKTTTGPWTTVTPPYSPQPVPRILPCTQLLKGDTGIPGLQGLKGDPGINGTNGEKGDPGQMGAQGPKGEVGDVLYVGRNCKELLDQGVIMSGWYTIYPDGMAPLHVLCDMDTDGGGWIVFQRRYDGSVDFYLGWDSYKKGFGSRLTDFWLGNDNLSNLTSAGTWDLRVDLRDFNNSAYYAKYSSFQISPASDNYTLTFGAFLGGNAGDSLSYHNQTSFSTKDRDNDRSLYNCAVEGFGAWWFNDCFLSDLNGVYQLQQSGNSFGITWQSANDYSYYSFKMSEMKIRPV